LGAKFGLENMQICDRLYKEISMILTCNTNIGNLPRQYKYVLSMNKINTILSIIIIRKSPPLISNEFCDSENEETLKKEKKKYHWPDAIDDETRTFSTKKSKFIM